MAGKERPNKRMVNRSQLKCRPAPNGTLTFVNEALCRYVGRRRDELVGYNWLMFLPEEERDAALAQLTLLTPKERTTTLEQRFLVGGEVLWQEWTHRAIFDDQGRVFGFESVGRDITKRKSTEEALEESKER